MGPTNRRIRAANVEFKKCVGLLTRITVGIGELFFELDFLAIEKLPCNVFFGFLSMLTLKVHREHHCMRLKIRFK